MHFKNFKLLTDKCKLLVSGQLVSVSVGDVYCLDAVMWVMFTDAVMPPSTFRCNASLIRYREIGCQPSLRTQKMNLIQKQ